LLKIKLGALLGLLIAGQPPDTLDQLLTVPQSPLPPIQ